MGLNARKPVFKGLGKNKGADQPALFDPISTFVIPLLESITSRLDTSEISIF